MGGQTLGKYGGAGAASLPPRSVARANRRATQITGRRLQRLVAGPYRVSGLYVARFGFTASAPSRRTLSAS